MAVNYSCQWDVPKNSWGCLTPCEQPKGPGARRLFHAGHNLGLRSVWCITLVVTRKVTSVGPTPGPPWGAVTVQLSSPQLSHSLPENTSGAWFSFILEELGWKSCQSLVPAAGSQAPVHGNAFPRMNGRKRWCVGNTQCCQSRGLWQRAHPVSCSLANRRLLSETLTRVNRQPRSCCSPLHGSVCGVGWIPVLGLLQGLIWCVPDLWLFTCDLTACLSSSCCAKQKLFPLRTLGLCHPEIHISPHITWAALAAAHPGPSREVLLVQSLLLLDILSQRDVLEKSSPMSSLLRICLCVLVSAASSV